jgi:UDP-glucose 4-epimerase
MKVLVTGITGRIGANLGAALLREGHAVRGLVWPQDPRVGKLRDLGVELQYGSITEPEDARRATEGVQVVYHLGGAFQGGGPFTDEQYFEINVRGTLNMLEAARTRKGLRQFVFASTDALYDKYVPGGMRAPIREDVTPRCPRGWYALSKSMGEELCLGYWRTYFLPVTVLRFAYVAGAGEILDFPQFYLSRLRGSHPELASQPEEERLLILRDTEGKLFKKHIADVRDIVHGCLCALDKEAAFGETFQLAGPRPFTWDEAIAVLSRLLDLPAGEVTLQGVPTFYEYDLSKARRLIDFQPQYDITRMLEDAAAYRRGEEIGILPTSDPA